MNSIRKHIGQWKCRIVDEWPYLRKHSRIPIYRKIAAGYIERLPPINSVPGEYDVEVHMLCGHRDVDMGIWSSWSLMRFIQDAAVLVVHSDGTITSEDEEKWRKVVPHMSIIHRDAADAVVKKHLGDNAGLVCKWRSRYGTSPQLVDSHLFGKSSKIIIMDTDVIVFKRPEALIDCLLDRHVDFAWCEDVRESYSAPASLLQEVTGFKMPRRFNCGFIVSRRLSFEDFEWLDQIMHAILADGRIDLYRYWACQTYYALLAARSEKAKMLPGDYSTNSGSTADNCVARHYVGIKRVRYRYYTEGLSRLIDDLGVEQSFNMMS